MSASEGSSPGIFDNESGAIEVFMATTCCIILFMAVSMFSLFDELCNIAVLQSLFRVPGIISVEVSYLANYKTHSAEELLLLI